MIFAICHAPEKKAALLNELDSRNIPNSYHCKANWVFVQGEPKEQTIKELKTLPGVMQVTAAINQVEDSYPWN